MAGLESVSPDGGIKLAIAENVATIWLDRPESRNAMTRAMWRAVPALMARLASDPGVRVLLLTGGSGAFCGGADISEFEDAFADPPAARVYNDLVEGARLALTNQPKPTIAVVDGVAVGAGCGLAMACDLRFAADTARFAMPPARLGAAYPFPGVRQMVSLIGPARAKDMLYSGRMVGADEASRIGLADRVLPVSDLMPAAHEYARTLISLSGSSQAISKGMVAEVIAGTDTETPELRALFDGSFASDDFTEGYRAFLEKRSPDFS